jgi:hypothetical protein
VSQLAQFAMEVIAVPSTLLELESWSHRLAPFILINSLKEFKAHY